MHVTLLTPDSSYEQFRSVWEARIALYRDLLAPVGIHLEPVAWPNARPLRPTLALLAWGYHLQPARWITMLATWPEEVLLFNAPRLLAWNSDKRYLAELGGKGVPIVPTRFAAVANQAELEAARAAFGMDELVVKPRISASAASTSRVGPGAPRPIFPTR